MKAVVPSFVDDARDVAITWVVLGAVLLVFVGPAFFGLRTPDPYLADGLSHGFLVKTIMDTGWFSHSRWVGAPFGSDFLDYPFADGLHFLMIRFIGLFTADWVVAANVFFIGGFFLAAASACVVLRRLGLASPWAIAGGVLFALLPYHLFRRRHLLLASYFAVPIGVYLALIAASAFPATERGRRSAWRTGALAVVVGSTGVYYAFFSAFLIVVGGFIGMLTARRWAAGRVAAYLVLVIALTIVVNAAPNVAFRIAHGPNPAAVVRSAADSETYGLRITQMVIPRTDHRVPAARALAERYATSVPMVHENQYALGLVGSLGLALLMVVALAGIAGARIGPPPVPILAALGIAALLLGTTGGLGAVLAYTVTAAIRDYTRISVVIGFVSLAILLVFLQSWLARVRIFARSGAGAAAAAGLVVIVGALDQTPRAYERAPDATFISDRAFVRDLESRLPPDTAVLQLPYQSYPEDPEGSVVAEIGIYGPLRGPLNSTSLRWSYAAVRGRAPDRWIRALLARDPAQMLALAAQSGFGAVYVDRRGYQDGGAAIESVLRSRLGPPIATSADGKLVAYALQKTGDNPLPLDALVSLDTPIELGSRSLPAAIAAIRGFSGAEPWGRWTEGPLARVDFVVPLPQKFLLRIDVAMATPCNVDKDIRVGAGSAEGRFRLRAIGPTTIEVPMRLATAATSIELDIPCPTSPRELGWSTDARPLGIGIKSITIVPS